MNKKTVLQIALETIVPVSMEPTTPYEINMVKMLTQFGERVLQECASGKCGNCENCGCSVPVGSV